MTARDKDTLKSYFNTGDVPTEQNYHDLIDSIFAGVSGAPEEGPGVDVIGSMVGLGGDTILLYHDDGTPIAEFSGTDAGLDLVAVAITSSEMLVELPAVIFSQNHTLAGCKYDCKKALFTKEVVTSDKTKAYDLTLQRIEETADALVGIRGPVTGKAWIYNLHITGKNIGSDFHCIHVNGDGDLEVTGLYIDGRNLDGGGIGYVAYRDPECSADLFLNDGKCEGSDKDNPFNE